MLFALYLAPSYLVFCTKTHCILHQNALHLASKRIAFSTKTQCVLHHIALFLATNGPQRGANADLLK